MAESAQKINANTFQYFTRNPRGGSAKALDLNDIETFLQIARNSQFAPIVAHAPYTLNLCSASEHIRKFSSDIFADDIARCGVVPGSYYNFHPGSHTGQGPDVGIGQISDTLNNILTPNQTIVVLLETMAGKGSEIGGSFEELKEIMNKIRLKDKIGVCFDTCHVFDAGYDLVNDLDGVLEQFDSTVGLKNLKAVHLNDSKNPCGSKKDRHEQIGKGMIGEDAIAKIVNHPALKNLPFILETPQESLDGYAKEIKFVRSVAQ